MVYSYSAAGCLKLKLGTAHMPLLSASSTNELLLRLKNLGWGVGVFLSIGFLTSFTYSATLAILFCVYLLMTEALDFVVGRLGLFLFCQAAICGAGAYSFALARISPRTAEVSMPDVTWTGGLNFIICLIFSAVFGLIAGVIVGLFTKKSRGDMFVFLSLSLQMLFFELILNADYIANGVSGLHGIHRPQPPNLVSNSTINYAAWVIPITLVCLWMLNRLKNSGFALILSCIREDEIAMRSMGCDTNIITLHALALSGSVSGLSGAFLSGYMQFIEPNSFSLDFGIPVLAILMISGPGSKNSPFISASILVGLPEAIRLLGFPTAAAANIRGIIYGIVLIFAALRKPTQKPSQTSMPT